VREVLHQLRLRGVQDTPAGALPTGTLRLVERGRALCTDPKVLLLDEPASGLDSTETEELQGVLRDVAAMGVAVLLVEHDVDLVFEAADDVYAMAEGRLLAHGNAESVKLDDRVQDVYLDPAGRG
jgi:branched-chain amino acid transport system ATP-binding protein